MDEKRTVIIGTAAVITITTITLLAVTQTPPPTYPANFTSLLLVSLDGFRADYRYRGLTPTLERMAKEGVSTYYMKPSYPTLTFPNHYTIVTGLYPASHGIIANSFYDPEYKESFSMSNNEGKWWWGEPIWLTLRRQGKRSATCFWPGSDSDINGTHPDYWFKYSASDNMPFEARIDQVMKWLSLPNDTRPHWVSLYMDEPDHTGHSFGPETSDVDQTLKRMDEIINRLQTALREGDLTDKVNVIVVADHGMVSAGPEKVINLTNYVPNIKDLAYSYDGSFSRINFKDNPNIDNDTKLEVLEALTCTSNTALRAYAKEDLPKRFHFDNNRRIEDIVLDLDEGFIVNTDESWSILGQHGYDNYYSAMNALFVAWGPDFREGVTLQPFQNIELYNLMCHLLGVQPAPNNGTLGSLYEALVDPPEDPDTPLKDNPPSAEFPGGNLTDKFNMSGCPGLLDEDDMPWLEDALKFTEDEMVNLTRIHLPWGVPQLLNNINNNTSIILLHHHDHVTGYSETLRMPLWTSLTLTQQPLRSNETDWSSDVRLENTTTPTCSSYNKVHAKMMPLFHPLLSTNEEHNLIPYLASNAVAAGFEDRWENLLNLLLEKMKTVKRLNLLMGPVVDWSALDTSIPSGSLVIPTDLFAVATWCRNPMEDINQCDSTDLRTYSFIYPQKEVDSNCLSAEKYSIEFSGRVRDVELATGLMFYPNFAFANRTSLVLAIRPPVWPEEN
ncbi:hypothetical protein Pcinc_018272 [Petrolisthes cinctipes]|uniref:ENPP1-3/EXOG-like endonuclease/phosphodiesterase domain-containing protein n=1 Tax=Petrolisthes cinctipes TaxID=88211 RepID=A0AAE1FEN3_PETCI|nr:hypothetical protein Pcinc_022147 [Petrolisthes cinctipes]KAK3876991.1 hypothetical protein Pcinc_018272 [Petrolisthes cinctipes]